MERSLINFQESIEVRFKNHRGPGEVGREIVPTGQENIKETAQPPPQQQQQSSSQTNYHGRRVRNFQESIEECFQNRRGPGEVERETVPTRQENIEVAAHLPPQQQQKSSIQTNYHRRRGRNFQESIDNASKIIADQEKSKEK